MQTGQTVGVLGILINLRDASNHSPLATHLDLLQDFSKPDKYLASDKWWCTMRGRGNRIFKERQLTTGLDLGGDRW